MKMTKTKAVVAFVGTLVTVLTGALADDVFSAGEVGEIVAQAVTGILTVIAVWQIPNKPAETPAQYR
jgi:hypothetical protein